jgi:protein-S-isoprenylcysteine O-methyltransferase Ste14
MIDALEWAVRAAGIGGLLTAWFVAGTAAARHRLRPVGRGLGLAPRIGALASYLVVAVPYFTIWALLWSPLPGTLPGWLRVIALTAGTIFGSTGLALYLWGKETLGDMYNVSSSLGSELYADHRLVTRGPFRYVRHPMYLGIASAAVGGLLVYRTWTMVFALLSVVGLFVKAKHEEELLAAEFGETWSDYARRVPAWFPRSTASRTELRGVTHE